MLEKKSGRPADPKNREKIVNAAIELFTQKGYESTTTLAISQKAGVSSSHMYVYFKNKEALFEEVMRQAYSRHYDMVVHMLQTNQSHDVYQLVDLCMDAFAQMRSRGLFILRCLATPALSERFADFFGEVEKNYTEIFQGLMDGLDDASKRFVTHALIAQVNNYFLDGDLEAAKDTIKHILRMCLR